MIFKLICVCSVVMLMVLVYVNGKTVQTKRIFVKTTSINLRLFKQSMKDIFNYAYNYTILPKTLHVFEYINNDDVYKNISFHNTIVTYFNGKIVYIEPITWLIGVLKQDPITVTTSSNVDSNKEYGSFENHLIEGQSYGMGVQEAWRRGYNGSGVVIASTDVGVDIDNPDLKGNIDKNLSYSFVSNDKKHLAPNRFTENDDILPEHLTDHGNRCCGLLAAQKDNDICCAGIAYGAKTAVLKIFKVHQDKNGMASNAFRNEYAAEALSHKLQDIDIFSNSWANKDAFHGLGAAMKDVLENGIKTGRQGKGTVYVFPTGPIGDGLVNNAYTITVSSIDKYGEVPRQYVELCAAVLTSVYGDSVRVNGDYMVTTSHPPGNCTLEFKGTSASTAMVSGIIALALQANKHLSWRDVQHLVVRASHKEGLVEAKNFKTNGAGHYYHAYLGFGLLDANYLVTLAKEWQNVSPQVSKSEVTTLFEKTSKQKMKWYQHTRYMLSKAHVTIACCVTRVEHVEVNLSYKSPNENNLEIALLSPADTQSILMDVKQSTEQKATWRSNVKFLSVHFWDEQANGTWTLVLKQNHYKKESPDQNFGLLDFSITVYGTYQGNQTFKAETSNDIDHSSDVDAGVKEDDRVESENVEYETEVLEIGKYKAQSQNDKLDENDVSALNAYKVVAVVFVIGFLLVVWLLVVRARLANKYR